MNFITAIEQGQAIIYQKGFYSQVPLFMREEKIFAKIGNRYVRLSQGGSTSAPNIRWYEIDTPFGTHEERQGSVFYTQTKLHEAAE